jgi:hypothetical protein
MCERVCNSDLLIYEIGFVHTLAASNSINYRIKGLENCMYKKSKVHSDVILNNKFYMQKFLLPNSRVEHVTQLKA